MCGEMKADSCEGGRDSGKEEERTVTAVSLKFGLSALTFCLEIRI